MGAETIAERVARMKAQAMRRHPFEGAGQYCEHMDRRDWTTSRGTWAMSVQCGYPVDLHPVGEDS